MLDLREQVSYHAPAFFGLYVYRITSKHYYIWLFLLNFLLRVWTTRVIKGRCSIEECSLKGHLPFRDSVAHNCTKRSTKVANKWLMYDNVYLYFHTHVIPQRQVVCRECTPIKVVGCFLIVDPC